MRGEQVNKRVELLRWTAGLGAVTAEALAVRECMTVASARAMLGAAVRAGQLTRHRPLTGRAALYTATRRGLKVAGSPQLRLTSVSPAGAQHLIACALAAARLQRRYPDHLVLGERALREHERRTGAPLASVMLGRGSYRQRLHRPDIVLLAPAVAPVGVVAVEVELTVKAPKRLAEICRAWARSRHVDGALYLAPPEVERALLRAIDAARAGDRVAVVPFEDLSEKV